jgi:hypothetical protein
MFALLIHNLNSNFNEEDINSRHSGNGIRFFIVQ